MNIQTVWTFCKKKKQNTVEFINNSNVLIITKVNLTVSANFEKETNKIFTISNKREGVTTASKLNDVENLIKKALKWLQTNTDRTKLLRIWVKQIDT